MKSATKFLFGVIFASVLLAGPWSAEAADVARGKKTYGELCAKCHGTGGKGDGKEAATLATKPKDYTDCAAMAKFTDADLQKVVKEGGQSIAGGSKDMPPYKDSLEDDEIADTVAFVRSFCAK